MGFIGNIIYQLKVVAEAYKLPLSFQRMQRLVVKALAITDSLALHIKDHTGDNNNISFAWVM